MPIDFSTEYSHRSDDELLHLATNRHSLTAEAATALDAELRRRNLTESDRVEYQKLVKRQEGRHLRRRSRKILGLRNQLTWLDILGAFAAMALISFTYIALPTRYHMKPDWQEAAIVVLITSVVVTFAFRCWREIAFWVSLGISSAIHLVVVHHWTRKIPNLSAREGKGAAFLGLVLFLIVYGVVRYFQRTLYGKRAPDST